MQKINLCNPEKSDINYSISKFPDGEVQITLGEINRKDYVEVHCRITNAEELFILMQVADILNRQGIEWDLIIYYLMGMRMDRVMDFNRPFTLKVITSIINGFECSGKLVKVLEPHSDRTCCLINHGVGYYPEENEAYDRLSPYYWETYEKSQIVYPDRGAFERYENGSDDAVIAEKVRNIKTGQIESIKITNPELFKDNDKPIMVVDDLCDAGGTFVGLAKEIRKHTDKELNVFVTHMVNEKGIKNLAENYDHVYFTNSYKDWKGLFEELGETFPENCTQIDVIDGDS